MTILQEFDSFCELLDLNRIRGVPTGKIKSFLTYALEKQKVEIVKICEGKKVDNCPYIGDRAIWNNALDTVINKIREMK